MRNPGSATVANNASFYKTLPFATDVKRLIKIKSLKQTSFILYSFFMHYLVVLADSNFDTFSSLFSSILV